MKYRLRLSRSIKTNYVALPSTNPFTQSAHLPFTNGPSCKALKLTALSRPDSPIFLGYAGATSQEQGTVEISYDLARLLNLSENEYVNVQLEYSFEKLPKIELEPLTADDFELIEKNCEFIESEMLNQVGVFYEGQLLVIYLNGNLMARLRSKIESDARANCYYLTAESELHIAVVQRQQAT